MEMVEGARWWWKTWRRGEMSVPAGSVTEMEEKGGGGGGGTGTGSAAKGEVRIVGTPAQRRRMAERLRRRAMVAGLNQAREQLEIPARLDLYISAMPATLNMQGKK